MHPNQPVRYEKIDFLGEGQVSAFSFVHYYAEWFDVMMLDFFGIVLVCHRIQSSRYVDRANCSGKKD